MPAAADMTPPDVDIQPRAFAGPAGGGEQGMTLVEVLVSMVILLVGMLGVFSLLDVGNQTTQDTLPRDAAVALAGEQLGRAREVPFASLSDVANVVTKLTSVVHGADPSSKVATTMPSILDGLALP